MCLACILSKRVVIDFVLILSLNVSVSPLRFVSSHDEILRVQLAETPA